jgi:glycosyltransferase involved in cell wall biosynthesis
VRILLISDAPWATSGYAVQAAQLGPIWRDLGHDVAYVAAFGLHGAQQVYNGFPVFPGGMDGFGNDAIKPAVQAFRPDIVITLKDLWVYQPQAWQVPIRWCPLVPVDHDPIPEPLISLMRQHVYEPIAYSQFGRDQLKNAGFSPGYAPHTYNPDDYYHVEDARAKLGIPDGIFAIGMVAVNRGSDPSRKAWPQNIEAFARYARVNPNARLFLHTHAGEHGREGAYNLPAQLAQLGVSHLTNFIDQEAYDAGLPIEYMRQFYSAMDVVNCVSIGEGFGIPTLEAQACGTPVIVGDWTASAELLFAGCAIDKADAFAYYDKQMSYVFLPQPDAVALAFDTMEKRLQLPGERAKLRAKALAGAAAYQIDTVRDGNWKPVLDRIAHRIATEHQRGVVRIVEPRSVLAMQEVAK